MNGHLGNTDVQNGRLGKASLSNLIEKPKNVNYIFVDLKHLLFQFWKSFKTFKFLKIKLAMNILDLNYSKQENNMFEITHMNIINFIIQCIIHL